MIHAEDFDVQEDGAVSLTEDGRRTFLRAWQKRKDDMIQHPFLEEKVEWGLLPMCRHFCLHAISGAIWMRIRRFVEVRAYAGSCSV